MKTDLAQAIDKVLSDERDVRVATAPYQSEFPYERDDEAQVTRREFCNFLFLTSSALFLGSAAFAGKLAYNSTIVHEFSPVKIEKGSGLRFADMFHGHNERIPVAGLAWGVDVLDSVVRQIAAR